MIGEATQHILIVDDAREIRVPLGRYMRGQGFRVTLAEEAAAARQALRDHDIDLVLLDIMMPGESGLTLCRELVTRGRPSVILITALTGDVDRIVGLELGADDYVTKPFNPRELAARIRGVLRRVGAPPPSRTARQNRHEFSGIVHDALTKKLHFPDGRVLQLTGNDSRILSIFLENPGQVLSREQIMERAFGKHEAAFGRAIDNAVSRLRKKIEMEPAEPRVIVTEWREGYYLAGPVEVTS